MDEAILSETKSNQHALLSEAIESALKRFPLLFDVRLCHGLERLLANSPRNFLPAHSLDELKKVLYIQFFLQKKMESSLKKENKTEPPLFVKVFRNSSSICIAITYPSTWMISKEQIFNAFRMLLPGIQEVPCASYIWHHPELPYLFQYTEVQKLRGEEHSTSELKTIEKRLYEHLLAIPPLTPALFWPYNEEESYRQLQLLQSEMHDTAEMPHVLIQFQEQTPSSLIFLIHFARPKSDEPITAALKQLPLSLQFFSHIQRIHHSPFPIELGAFSLKVPSSPFDVRGSINLLYARRYVMKYLQTVLGTFRDYNGGLFEKQQQHFETIRAHLSENNPLFELFAEKLFYALHPVEKRLSLSLEDASELFTTFYHALAKSESSEVMSPSKNVIVFKTASSADISHIRHTVKDSKESLSHAQLTLGKSHFFCIAGPKAEIFHSFFEKKPASPDQKTKTLRLCFQEGAPISLNPYHSSGDMRSRVLSKLLFEGLTRLDRNGKPELAGASRVQVSSNDLTYTFSLRPCRWSNGEIVSATDYAASWKAALRDRVSHPEHLNILKNAVHFKNQKNNLSKIGVEALDPSTLRVELEHPDPEFLHKLSRPYFFPIFGSMKEPKWFNGPYLVRKQQKAGMLLEKNPYYWNIQAPYYDQINIQWIHDIETIFTLFQEKKIDWIGEPLSTLPPQYIRILQSSGALAERTVSRRFCVNFNTSLRHLSNSSIRRALSLSIDREAICKEVFPFSTPLEPYRPQPELARHHFEKGLKELNWTQSEFPALTLSYSHQPGREGLAQSLQSTWQSVLGITIRLEKVDWDLYRNRLEKGRFEIAGSIQERSCDSLEFLKRFEGESSWNFSQWTNLRYRQLLCDETSRDIEERIALAKTILEEEVPFTSLFHYIHLYAHSPHLSNYRFDEEGCVDFYQSKEKR